MKKPADFFLKPDHEEDRTYQSDDDKTVNSSDLFSKINHESGLDSPPNDFKTTMSSPTSIGGINAPIGAVRPFTNLLSPIAKTNSKTCPNFFDNLDSQALSLDLASESNASSSQPTTSPGRNAPLRRRHDPKRRHSI